MSIEFRSADTQSPWLDRGIHWTASAFVRTIQTCVALNRKVGHLFDGCFPQMKLDIFDLYDKTVAEHMNGIPGALIVDVGGGKHCRFVKYK